MDAGRWIGDSPEDAQRQQQRQKLRDWINHVREDVAILIANRAMFRRVIDMWRNNSKLRGTRSSFYDWMWRVYTPSIAIAIRRQVDTKNKYDPRSFYRFFKVLGGHSELISRNWILLSLADQQPDEWKQERIDALIGRGNAHLQALDVYTDQRELTKAAAGVKVFADKRVAHRDPGALEEIPTFADADKAIDTMERLLRKYLQLVGEPVPDSFIPRPQWPDDDLAFRIPWITEPQQK